MDSSAEAALQQLGVTKEEYIEFTRLSVAGRRLLNACLSLLIYDYILTFRREFVDVWQRPPTFSAAKALFGLNRYWPIINYIIRVWVLNRKELTSKICNIGLGFSGWSSVFNIVVVELVLMLRVWALYDKSRPIGIFLAILFVTCVAATFALRRVHPKGHVFVDPLPVSLTQCVRSTPSEYFFLYSIGLVVETTVFALLISRAWRYSLGSRNTPLINALLTHGIIYFAAVIATLILVIISTFSNYLYEPIADSNLIVAITSMACNRLILSLRGLYFKRGALTTTENPTGATITRAEEINLSTMAGSSSDGKPSVKKPTRRHLHHVSTFTEDDIEGGLSISRVGIHS